MAPPPLTPAAAPKYMTVTLLIIASAFLPADANLNHTYYVVTVCSELKADAQETLCAHIKEASEDLNLTITLMTEAENVTILDEQPVAQFNDFYYCPTFTVPDVTSFEVAEIHVLIKDDIDEMSKTTKVLLRPRAFVNLIQSDKPIYKPGQTVQFRIVSLGEDFIPINRTYKIVELQDPNGNRIAQWLDKTSYVGILDLFQHMSPEAAQGTYVITAWTAQDDLQISHSFEIKEYVLPKFEVTVEFLSSVISILDREVTMQICGKYTYGKPVIGQIKVVLCRRAYRYHWYRYDNNQLSDICKTYERHLCGEGCVTIDVKVADFAPTNRAYEDEFTAEAELQEDETGVTLTGTGSVKFTSDIRIVTFEDISTTYLPGIPFEAKVKVIRADASPAVDEVVFVSATSEGLAVNLTLTTDLQGMATFSLDTTVWKDRVFLQARCTEEEGNTYESKRVPRYRSAHTSVTEFYSQSQSFVKLSQPLTREPFHCCDHHSLHTQYLIPGSELAENQTVLNFFYLLTSRGRVVQTGLVPVDVTAEKVNNGTFYVDIEDTAGLPPYAQVVVYAILPTGEVVADSKDFPVDPCLKNEVYLRFQSDQALPAEKISLYLRAAPHSLCSVRAIDQSVLLLKPEDQLDVEYVFSLLPVDRLSGYNYQLDDKEQHLCLPKPVPLPVDEPEAIGIKILTNCDVKKPYDCDHIGPPVAMPFETLGMSASSGSRLGGAPAPSSPGAGGSKDTVRTHFPETWIWDLVTVGEEGRVFLEKTVPDTITEWTAGAICTSATEGLGISPTTALVAFQPFFISLTLPYSVINGETFTLKATVFSYLPKCIMVKATLSRSKQYEADECDRCVYKLCLCDGKSHTFKWMVTPNTIGEVSLEVSAELVGELCGERDEWAFVPEKGRKDTVVRPLLVEAEGVPQTITHNAYLCPTEGHPMEEIISLDLPDDFIVGSDKAFVTVLGDLMGRAMQNLDKLLTMPYGCGEQNMVKFAPNIYILQYLQATRQLTPEIQERAIRFLETGYQRQLNYKHDDGSYSAFGKNDKSGNTWLTAFVMKSFSGAKPFIFVDPKHAADANEWLIQNQNQDTGCINSVGRLLNNGMKGGVSDDITLTAYITAAILEAGPENNTTDLVMGGLTWCLQNAVSTGAHLKNNYTAALLAYTFALAGDRDLRYISKETVSEFRRTLIKHLKKTAIEEDGAKHWERVDGPGDNTLDSLAVEMTSYVLLAILSGPPIPIEDDEMEMEVSEIQSIWMECAASTVRWLAQQQNPWGGFASTQDTVVALQALALFASVTYVPEGNVTVNVTAPELVAQFHVSESNRLLLQEAELVEIPWDYKIRAEGEGCVFAQIALHYNIPPPEDSSYFNISACVIANCSATRPQLAVTVGVKYRGSRDETNMCVIDIKLLSGYVVIEDSITLIKKKRLVKRVDVDVEKGHIYIYVEGLKQGILKTFKVLLEEEEKVLDLSPAVIKIYDYYTPCDEASNDYTTLCAESGNQLKGGNQ